MCDFARPFEFWLRIGSSSYICCRANMDNGDSPAGGPLRVCRMPGCSVQFLVGRHETCCSHCIRSDGARHSRRCRRDQRHLLREHPSTRRQTVPCSTPSCGRLTGNGFRSCCSSCHHTGGNYHSHRCDGLQPLPLDLRLATQPLHAAGLGEAAGQNDSCFVASSTPVGTTAVNLHSAASDTSWRDQLNEQEQWLLSECSGVAGQTELDGSKAASRAAGPHVDLQAMD